MKTFLKLLFSALFVMLGTTASAASINLSPFALNSDGLDPGQGTAAKDDIFRDVTGIDGFEDKAGEFVAPAWMEMLTLISPANYPFTTFLTQKVLDGVRGFARAESIDGKHADLLIKTDAGDSRFNPNYMMKKDKMQNISQFDSNKAEAIKNYKLNWGYIAVLPMQDSLGAALAGGAASETVAVNNANMWKPTDTIKVQGYDYADGDELILYISAVDTSAETITLRTLNDSDGAGRVIPVVADATRITRLGTASASGAVTNVAISQAPTSDYNYAQKFITSVVYDNFLMMTQLFANYSQSLVTNLALQDFRYSQEFSFMFGARSETSLPAPSTSITSGDQTVRTTGGLTYFLDNFIEYGTGGGDTTITESDIVDFTKSMRIGNNGSDTRFLFAGSELISSLNKGVMNDSTRFVTKEYQTVYGLSFSCLYSFFGTINVTYAPLMDQTEYIDRGFLLDMRFIDKAVFQPFRETRTDLVKLRQFDGEAVDMVETCLLVPRNLDTHFIFKVKA